MRSVHQVHNHDTHITTWAQLPTVKKAIVNQLNTLQNGSVPLTLITVRGIVITMLMSMAPKVFEIKEPDGSSFQCSDSFLQQWLHNTMGWSEHKATYAARKIPDNWEDICKKSILHMAFLIKEEDVPTLLYINSNQTQIVYVQESNLT